MSIYSPKGDVAVKQSTANRFAVVMWVFVVASAGCFIGAAWWKALS